MKQEHQDDLDRLLDQVPLPQAPAWFETRLMARILREKATPLPWWKRYAKEWVVYSMAAVVVLLAVWTWSADLGEKSEVAGGISSSETNIAATYSNKAHLSKEEKIVAALSAFASYQEDNQVWLVSEQ